MRARPIPIRSISSKTLANPRGINQYKRIVAEIHGLLDNVACGTWNSGNDCAIDPKHQVENARFTDIGLTNNRGARSFANDPAAGEALMQNCNAFTELGDIGSNGLSRGQIDFFVTEVDLSFEVSTN